MSWCHAEITGPSHAGFDSIGTAHTYFYANTMLQIVGWTKHDGRLYLGHKE